MLPFTLYLTPITLYFILISITFSLHFISQIFLHVALYLVPFAFLPLLYILHNSDITLLLAAFAFYFIPYTFYLIPFIFSITNR